MNYEREPLSFIAEVTYATKDDPDRLFGQHSVLVVNREQDEERGAVATWEFLSNEARRWLPRDAINPTVRIELLTPAELGDDGGLWNTTTTPMHMQQHRPTCQV